MMVLKTLDMPALVSEIVFDAAEGRLAARHNVTISDLDWTEDALAFTALEGALPWPIDPEAVEALSIIPAVTELNRQMLRITGLVSGAYNLTIDDAEVGEFTAAELEHGVNLAMNDATPQLRQVRAVSALLEERREAGMRLRRLASNEHYLFHDLGIDLDDFTAVKKKLLEFLATPPIENDKRDAHRRERSRICIEAKPRSAEFRAEQAQLLERAYETAQPVARRYALRRTAVEAP